MEALLKGTRTRTQCFDFNPGILYTSAACRCVPGLLDGLHPFVALALLLGAQLQGLLSVVAEHDEEVVLRRHGRKRVTALVARKMLLCCTRTVVIAGLS